jgi:phosphoserine phosphatase RsbU/P
MDAMTAARRYLSSPIAKQGPIALLVAFAAVLSVAVPSLPVSSPGAFAWSLAVMALATALAAACTRSHRLAGFVNLVPAIDFIAIGVFRYGTGSSQSIFTSLLVLPLVWLAAQERHRFIAYGLGGIAVALLTPFAFEVPSAEPVAELLRLVFTLCTFGTVGGVVHVLSRQAWRQVRAAQLGEERVTLEIDRAAAVQRSLLPRALCAMPGVSVAGSCLPAATVGGDFFDWYRTDNGLAITLGDVMGKGVGAGLIAAAVRAVVRSAHADGDPGAALRRASDGLAVDAVDRSDGVAFTTLFHARLESGVLRWADAGHGLTVLVRADGTHERLATKNLPLGLGIDDDWETSETVIEPGDMVVCFSDGVLDLFGGGLETIERVVEIARRTPEPVALVETISELAGHLGHEDDVTVVALRRDSVVVPTGSIPTATILTATIPTATIPTAASPARTPVR